MIRVTIKQLEDRIKTINGLTNNKYQLRLGTTTGCGVDISINGEWQAEKVNGFSKDNSIKNFTNKEAMAFLNKMFGNEIREIITKEIGNNNV